MVKEPCLLVPSRQSSVASCQSGLDFQGAKSLERNLKLLNFSRMDWESRSIFKLLFLLRLLRLLADGRGQSAVINHNITFAGRRYGPDSVYVFDATCIRNPGIAQVPGGVVNQDRIFTSG